MQAELLRQLIAERHRRSRFVDAALLGEPAWDILLDLALADATGRKLAITAACIGSGVPATTALRYIDTLIERGLAARRQHPFDRRSSFLELTEAGRSAMQDYLGSIASTERKAA